MDPLRELSVSQAFAVGKQCRCVTQLRGPLLYHRGKNAITIMPNRAVSSSARNRAFPTDPLVCEGAVACSVLTRCSPR